MRRIGGTERAFSALQCREPAIGPALFAFSPSPCERISAVKQRPPEWRALLFLLFGEHTGMAVPVWI